MKNSIMNYHSLPFLPDFPSLALVKLLMRCFGMYQPDIEGKLQFPRTKTAALW